MANPFFHPPSLATLPMVFLFLCGRLDGLDKVVGRLAGDQRGVVRDALVSEGVMEALLAVVGDSASSSTQSTQSRAAESGLALLCLADLAAGSERAKVNPHPQSMQQMIAVAAAAPCVRDGQDLVINILHLQLIIVPGTVR